MNKPDTQANISFITSNKGKVASLRKWLKGTNISIYKEQRKIFLHEEKLATIEDTAVQKALTAKEMLKGNFVVQDSGFFLDAKPGFPGPNVNHVLSTIGIGGILEIISGEIRTCYFEDVLAFYSPNLKSLYKTNQTIIFEGETSRIYSSQAIEEFNQDEPILLFISKVKGKVALEPSMKNAKNAWSDLWRIFIPDGFSATLGEMTKTERKEFDRQRGSPESNSFVSFSKWASKHVGYLYLQKSFDALLKSHSK